MNFYLLRVLIYSFFTLLCSYSYGALPDGVRSELEKAGYEIVGKDQFAAGGESDIYKLKRGETFFVFKYPRVNDRNMQRKTAQLFSDLRTLNAHQLAPEPQRVVIEKKEYLILPLIDGPTLRDSAIQGLELEQSDKLIKFYERLVEAFPKRYVSDLHANNVMWDSKIKDWQIIDTNGIVKVHIHPIVSYRNEMCFHHSTAGAGHSAEDERCARELNDKVVCILDQIIHIRVATKLDGFDPFNIFCSQMGFYIEDNGQYLQYNPTSEAKFSFINNPDNATTFELVPYKTGYYYIKFYAKGIRKWQYMMVDQRHSDVLVASGNTENWEAFELKPESGAEREQKFRIYNIASRRFLLRVGDDMDSIQGDGGSFKLVTFPQLRASRSSS